MEKQRERHSDGDLFSDDFFPSLETHHPHRSSAASPRRRTKYREAVGKGEMMAMKS